jgi:hypothetical protein
MIDVKSETFLGVSDMVKTIHLQAKDSLGNNISTIYDTLDIKISQNHGLIQGFYFFKFPYATTLNYQYNSYKKIKIIGIPHLGLGVDNLTAADVYDFNVGDEFHRVETSDGSSTNGLLCEDKDYRLMEIKSKQFSNNGDSVYYDVHLQHYRSDCTVDFPPISSTTVFDTIFIGDTIIAFDISANNKLNTKTLNRDADSTLWVQSFDGERKFITGLNTIEWNASGCYPFSVTPQTFYDFAYQKGVGLSAWGSYSLGESLTGELVYSKIKGVEWGTPINIDDLVTTKSIQKEISNLKVFPNPTSDILNFQFDDLQKNTEIRIYSTIGQLVEQTALPLPTTDVIQFDVSDYQTGVYFYGVYIDGVLKNRGQILIN